jgi:rfaE bifunctional protein kinase chain/domain
MLNNLEIFNGIARERLDEILNKIRNVKVGFIGDLCIDIYWIADMKKSELSRETPHFPLPVVEERYQLGAGGNVIANLASLKLKKITAVGVIGDDWRSELVRKCLSNFEILLDNIVTVKGKTTNAYCKPIRTGISEVEYEDPRIDFTSEPVTEGTEKFIVDNLIRMAEEVQAICVSDQFFNGCITEKVREVINQLASSGVTVIVDSRDRITKYRNVILKPNEVESVKAASALSGCTAQQFIEQDIEGYMKAANIINKELGCDISITLGKRGNIQFSNKKAVHILPRDVYGPLDFCGAGDTFLSAYTISLAAGANREEAGQIAALASEVTICKVGQTGTVTEDEIISMFEMAYQ